MWTLYCTSHTHLLSEHSQLEPVKVCELPSLGLCCNAPGPGCLLPLCADIGFLVRLPHLFLSGRVRNPDLKVGEGEFAKPNSLSLDLSARTIYQSLPTWICTA